MVGVIWVVEELGFCVLEDFFVVGFDGIEVDGFGEFMFIMSV